MGNKISDRQKQQIESKRPSNLPLRLQHAAQTAGGILLGEEAKEHP